MHPQFSGSSVESSLSNSDSSLIFFHISPFWPKFFFRKCAKALQLCLALCNPVDCSPPGSSIMGFSRQENWSGLPFPSPGDLPDPGIKPTFLMSPSSAGGFFTTSTTLEDLESIDGQLFGYLALVPTHLVLGSLIPKESRPQRRERDGWEPALLSERLWPHVSKKSSEKWVSGSVQYRRSLWIFIRRTFAGVVGHPDIKQSSLLWRASCTAVTFQVTIRHYVQRESAEDFPVSGFEHLLQCEMSLIMSSRV